MTDDNPSPSPAAPIPVPDVEPVDDELTSSVELADRFLLDRCIRVIEIALRPCDIGTARDVALSATAGEAISALVIAACERGTRILGADL